MTEDSFIVKGGKPLKGDVFLSGAKNVSLKVIIASLLFDDPVYLDNIPHIADIQELLHLCKVLGCKAEFSQKNKLLIDGSGLKESTVDLLHGSKIRVSFMFFAPLLQRLGKAQIPNPGGCRIGARPIDRHIDMLKVFGIRVKYNSSTGFYDAALKGKIITAANYSFDKPTHTGTELAILLACRARGESVIKNAALEPEIDDLIGFLNKSGAKIKRNGKTIVISGVNAIESKSRVYKIMCDRNEAVTYAIFALATGGDIRILGLSGNMIAAFIDKARGAGAKVKIQENQMEFSLGKELRATKVLTEPHPGFMTDWQGPWAVLMTQAKGTSIIHETIFEGRFSYVEELAKLGAQIEFFDPGVKNPRKFYHFNWVHNQSLTEAPQAIKIYGGTKLHNGVLTVNDLRAGATVLVASAAASGRSVVQGASIIDRGYENVEEKLKILGADIRRI